MRFNLKRDANDLEIFRALEAAGCNPVRGRDTDIYARHRKGFGVLIEVKVPGGRLRPLQKDLQGIFGAQYHVATTAEAALNACGVST